MNALMRIDGCLGPDADTPWRRREREGFYGQLPMKDSDGRTEW